MVRPSSFCLGLVHPILVATAMVEAEARTSLEWRPLQPQRRPIATVPLLRALSRGSSHPTAGNWRWRKEREWFPMQIQRTEVEDLLRPVQISKTFKVYGAS